MSLNAVGEDLRSRKTEKALYAAMFSLLRKISFKKITIKGICEQALISRAAFYAHFIDKYDLLKHWIPELWPKGITRSSTYAQIEKEINGYINENTLIIKNLICDADDETIGILFDFLLSAINLTVEKNSAGETYSQNVVLANFYAGGIISYLSWQVKNKFPSNVPLMNVHFYEMIHELQNWRSS